MTCLYKEEGGEEKDCTIHCTSTDTTKCVLCMSPINPFLGTSDHIWGGQGSREVMSVQHTTGGQGGIQTCVCAATLVSYNSPETWTKTSTMSAGLWPCDGVYSTLLSLFRWTLMDVQQQVASVHHMTRGIYFWMTIILSKPLTITTPSCL